MKEKDMADQEQEQRKTVTVVVKCQYPQEDGVPFGFDLTIDLEIEQIPRLVSKLIKYGVTPAQTPYTWKTELAAQHPPQAFQGQPVAQPQTGPAPVCPVHQTPMAVSKFGGWYCKTQTGVGPDGKGIFCDQKVKAA